MGENIKTNKVPEGYIKKRRRATMIFMSTIYAACVMVILIHFNIGSEYLQKVGGMINYSIMIANIATMLYTYRCKRIYNKIPMIKYRDTSVFSRKEKVLLILPVLPAAYFQFLLVLGYLALLGGIYVAISRFNREYDSYDHAAEWRGR